MFAFLEVEVVKELEYIDNGQRVEIDLGERDNYEGNGREKVRLKKRIITFTKYHSLLHNFHLQNLCFCRSAGLKWATANGACGMGIGGGRGRICWRWGSIGRGGLSGGW